MVVTVSSSDPRSVKALALLAQANAWTKGHRKDDGRAFFVIPGSQGRIYWTDCRECTCPDFARNAPVELGFACKHVRAVRLWKLKLDGERAQRPRAPRVKPEPRCTACGGSVPQGVIVGTCNKPECYDAADIFEGVAAVKALFDITRDAIVQTV